MPMLLYKPSSKVKKSLDPAIAPVEILHEDPGKNLLI